VVDAGESHRPEGGVKSALPDHLMRSGPPMPASGPQEPPTFPTAVAGLVRIADAGGQREGAMEILRRKFLHLAAGN
jgi:hypothetical protein